MKRIIILNVMLSLIMASCSDRPSFEDYAEERKEFFKKIACGNNIQSASLRKDSTGVWKFNIEVFDDISLLPGVEKSTATQKEIYHQFWGTFKKDAANNWQMYLDGYQLHHYTSDGKVGVDGYCLSMYGFEKGRAWVCDYWEMEDFPWLLKNKKIHLDVNQFDNIDEAATSLIPPNGLCVYNNIKNEIPKVLK